MFFLNGSYLWWLFAAGAPVLIHLIFRQAYRRQPWAAMEFLLRALKKQRKRLLVENLLLLLLRVLAVLFIVLAFTRPGVRLASWLLRPLTRSESDLILVVDTSYSMTFRDGTKSTFDRSVEMALRFVEQLGGRDNVALLQANDRPQILVEFTPNHQTVNRLLKNLQPTGGGTDISGTLAKISELVKDPRFRRRGPKRVVFLTDLMRSGWVDKGRPLEGVSKGLAELSAKVSRFHIVDLGSAANVRNLSVDRVASADKMVGTNLPAEFLATISNRANVPASNVRVDFLVGGKRKDTQTIRLLKARESRDVVFSQIFPDSGATYVSVLVDGDKQLTIDDRRHYAFNVIEKVDILLVDGDPQDWSDLSETHYLFNALSPPVSEGNQARRIFKPRQIDRRQFQSTRIVGRGLDMVILANLGYLSEEKQLELVEYVKAGGSLLIFVGDQIRAEGYNRRLFTERKLLPGTLSEKPVGEVDLRAKLVPLTPGSFNHPLFWYFRRHQALFQQELVARYWPVKPDDSPGAKVNVLARWGTAKDGPPAILERQLGLGKVMLVTTTADADWHPMTNPEFTPLYLPLIQETVYYLISRAAAGRNLLVHSPVEVSLREYAQEVRLARPDLRGNPKDEATKLPRVTEVFRYEDTDVPGVYRLELDRLRTTPDGRRRKWTERAYYAIGVDPAEGELEHLGKRGVTGKYKALAKAPFSFGRQVQSMDQDLGPQNEGEIWHLLVLLALLCLGAESILAMRMGK